MDRKRKFVPGVIIALIAASTAPADTIRLKDGTVIRGQVIGFRDQQFTVLVGTGARGRSSRMMLYVEDVESIEFDSANQSDTTNAAPLPTESASTQPSPPNATRQTTPNSAPAPTTQASNNWVRINVRVLADNTANGWTNTGLVVRRGQLLRISATGQVSLGNGVYSTPAGIPTLPDPNKLIRDEPTGALIAVIGDDNDDFIFIGRQREFRAQRDGVLFLGINEGNLNDNSGFFNAVVEAEVPSSQPR